MGCVRPKFLTKTRFPIWRVALSYLSELSELSAGETRLANIIILLSLRHLLEEMTNTSVNILLLDEILDSLDDDNAMVAIEMIKELSSDYCIMLITHTLKSWIQADEEYNF
jgi:DNA repair exonuclease SbcCD ATPase subunit